MVVGICPLKGTIQHYKWGGYSFLPSLLNIENNAEQPHAELWMGAHHKGPAEVWINDMWISFDVFLSMYPEVLGARVSERFGSQFPYLFKVLDVNNMLSIQAHPTKEKAEIGFKREEAEGIPIAASNRVYRDDNHKPEVMVALTDFWLLHGFRQASEIKEMLDRIPAFDVLQPLFEKEDIYTLYKHIMEMPQEEVNEILLPMKEEMVKGYENGDFDKSEPAYWAGKAFKEDILGNGDADRGIFSIFLFNLVNVAPGQGIYQGAGVPHAYLEGVNVELMANSDNVFRGGLTYKHIDVPELLDNLVFEPVTPDVFDGTSLSETETNYPTPAPDFELAKITLEEDQRHLALTKSVTICLVMEGEVRLHDGQVFAKGKSFLIPANTSYQMKTNMDKSVVFLARVPIIK